MKKYLIDPKQMWCKANLHCHTVLSDGCLTPEEIKERYMAKGYSVVAYSDHEILHDNSYLCDDRFVALTAVEYSINDHAPHWRDEKTIHINLFSRDPHNTFHVASSVRNAGRYYERFKDDFRCDGYDRVYTKEGINEVIRRANEAGFLVQYNHPNWSLNTREDYMAIEGLWSLEILNYCTELETGAEYCPYIYEDMLNSGKRLLCSMGDDNHNGDKGDFGSYGGATYIGVDSLSYENVFAAMEKGNIYCSSGPRILSLYVEGDTVVLDCDPATNVVLTSKNRRFMNRFGAGFTHVEFPINEAVEYFRLTVFDDKGGRAHTSAYYLEDLKK